MTWHPLPSTGSRWSLFPCFDGTMRCSELLPPFSPRFVVLRLAIPSRAPVFVSPASPTPAWGLELCGLATPGQLYRHGDDRNSQVPGEPSCAYALLYDPGWSDTSGLTMRQHGPRWWHGEGSKQEVISGLNHTASALAVYASPGGSPHKTQDSLPGTGQALPDGIGYPQGPYERFPRCVLTSPPPFPSFPGASHPPIIRGAASGLAGSFGIGWD
jgi:hypothetical protein